MFKKSMLGLCGLALWAMAGVAAAADAHVKSMSYSTQAIYQFDVINVYSSDGQQWDTLSGPPVKFGAIMDVDTRWPGWIISMGVLNGYCVDGGCYLNPTIWAENTHVRDLHWSRVFEIDMADIPISNDEGIATIPLGNEILQVCNNHLSANGADSLYTFNRSITTSFSVDTFVYLFNNEFPPTPEYDPHDNFLYGDETRQAEFQVQVRCNPYISDGWQFIPPAPPVNDIELFLATFSNAITQPDAFRTCQQGRILVRVTTGHEGPVALRLWTDAGEGLAEEVIEAWSADIGSGVYQAEIQRWVSVSETSQLQAMAEVWNGGVSGMSSGWDLLPLECVTGTGDLTDGGSPIDVPARGGKGGLTSP